jgi:hypothetical protein
MYENTDNTKIGQKIQNAPLMNNLFVEMNKLNKKYTSLLIDVKEWMDATKNGVLEQSIAKLKQSQEVNCY